MLKRIHIFHSDTCSKLYSLGELGQSEGDSDGLSNEDLPESLLYQYVCI